MKTIFLFAGSQYYPNGGWGDFINSFSTLGEAMIAIDKNNIQLECDWWQIVDIETKNILDSWYRY